MQTYTTHDTPYPTPSWVNYGPWFNIKIPSYQYRTSHCGGKTILRPSYLHNGMSYTGKMASLYWIGALGCILQQNWSLSKSVPAINWNIQVQWVKNIVKVADKDWQMTIVVINSITYMWPRLFFQTRQTTFGAEGMPIGITGEDIWIRQEYCMSYHICLHYIKKQ